jgi:PAS domain S-box-containing protein
MKAESLLIDWNGPNTLSIDQKIALINKVGCDSIRFKRSESSDLIWFNGHLPIEIQEEVRSILEQLMEGNPETVEKFQNSGVTLKQDQKIIAWTNTILIGEGGETIGSLSSGKNISSQVLMEKAQCELYQNFQLLFDNANAAILILQDGQLKYANRQAAEISGLPQAELIDRKLIDLIDPDDRKIILDNNQAILEEGGMLLKLRLITEKDMSKFVEMNTILTTWDGRPATLIIMEESNQD